MLYEDVDVLIPFRPTNQPHREKNARFIYRHLQRSLPGARITLCDDPDPELFNRGRALNAGVAATDRPILVFADGDVWIPLNALQSAVMSTRRWNSKRSYVVPFDKIIWMDELWSAEVLRGDKPIATRPSSKHIVLEWGQTSVGICNVVRRERFLDFGGFDPRYRGWGCEDVSWDAAAETLGGPKLRLRAEGRHLYHPVCESKSDAKRMAAIGALWERYGAARGNREQMRALIEEGKQCGF